MSDVPLPFVLSILPALTEMISQQIGRGGGFISNSATLLARTNITFRSNSAVEGKGGSLAVLSYSQVKLEDGVKILTSLGRDGGGIYMNGDCVLFCSSGVLVSGNVAHGIGAGLYLGDRSSAVLQGLDVSGNEASSGGGACVTWESSAVFEGGLVASNKAGIEAGGIYVRRAAVDLRRNPTRRSCIQKCCLSFSLLTFALL